MSSWLWPTTADVGMRVFGHGLAHLFEDAAYGMMSYLMSEQGLLSAQSVIRTSGEWNVRPQHGGKGIEALYLAWLDEILYRAEVRQEWLVECQVRVTDGAEGWEVNAQVSWVDAQKIEREVEIKAVTTHRLVVRQVEAGQTVQSEWNEVPVFEGPGWYADVVFDI